MLQLLLGHEIDELAGQLAVAVRKVLTSCSGETVHALWPSGAVRLGVGAGRQPSLAQRLQVPEGALLRNFEVGGDLA